MGDIPAGPETIPSLIADDPGPEQTYNHVLSPCVVQSADTDPDTGFSALIPAAGDLKGHTHDRPTVGCTYTGTNRPGGQRLGN